MQVFPQSWKQTLKVVQFTETCMFCIGMYGWNEHINDKHRKTYENCAH